MMSFSTHHLLATFTHKSSVTVAELRDYITRRKNKESQYLVKRGENACTRSRIRIDWNQRVTLATERSMYLLFLYLSSNSSMPKEHILRKKGFKKQNNQSVLIELLNGF